MRPLILASAFAASAVFAQGADWYPSEHGADDTLGDQPPLGGAGRGGGRTGEDRQGASLDVVAVGADSWGLEAVPGEDPELVFPVHPELLAKNGIYILENMNVEALAADEGWEFLFVLGQPRFEGAVQAVTGGDSLTRRRP